MREFECKIKMYVCGDNSEKEAFVYKLKNSSSDIEVTIEDKGKCWDVIVYNRFFYDDEDSEKLNGEVFIR